MHLHLPLCMNHHEYCPQLKHYQQNLSFLFLNCVQNYKCRHLRHHLHVHQARLLPHSKSKGYLKQHQCHP